MMVSIYFIKSHFTLKIYEFLISKLPNIFLSEMSFLDSVEHVPKNCSVHVKSLDNIFEWMEYLNL